MDLTTLTRARLAARLEHTLLDPEAGEAAITQLCAEAEAHAMLGVCVRPMQVALAADRLHDKGPIVVSVAGFPEGTQPTGDKVAQARQAMVHGAAEIDMVLNRELLEQRRYGEVFDDVRAVAEAIAPAPLKVILETVALEHEQKLTAAPLVQAAGARFLKTSTGYGPGGAMVEDVALLARLCGPGVEVKASGGVRNFAQAAAMLAAGATRIGCSASLAILSGCPDDSSPEST